MEGRHIRPDQLEGTYCNTTRDHDFLALLRDYRDLLQRLMGPRGGTLLVETHGGSSSYINNSKEFTERVRPHHPCLKLVNAVMQSQGSVYGGGEGLWGF